MDIKDVLQVLDAAEDYVFNLSIESLLSHIDPNYYFSRLANLNSGYLSVGYTTWPVLMLISFPSSTAELELTFGAPNIRKNYERSLFGMKIFDAEKLAGCIKVSLNAEPCCSSLVLVLKDFYTVPECLRLSLSFETFQATDVLTSLVLPCNLLDDELLTLLMGGLIQNQTVTHLDLSHNK